MHLLGLLLRQPLAVLRDLRLAFQSLRRSPGFTLIAIVTLGLGIGANTSMFSLMNGYLLRPPPYPDAERVDRIFRTTSRTDQGGISPADYLELKPETVRYGEIAAYGFCDLSLAEPGRPAELAVGIRTSANLFTVLGARPRLGRGFRPDEEVLGNHRVLVISDRYWRDRFAGDPQVVGRTVRVEGEPHVIVGVLPPDFSDWRHLGWVDVFRPLALDDKELRDRSSTWVRLVGRRSERVSRGQASAFVAGFGRRLASDFPAANADTGWSAVPIEDSFLPKDAKPIFAMLIGLSGFVLLIACSNLANLFLARTMARAREFAVRSAIGASRAQVLRPLFAESLLLAFAGGLCAVVVARWTFDWMAVASAGDNGVGVAITLDWRVLAWMFGACVFTAVAFGVAPAVFVQRLDPNRTLKSGSRGMTGDRGHRRFRDALIVAQFALAMVLLGGAGFFVRGLDELNNRRHGWESDRLVTGTILLPTAAYPGDRQIGAFQERALARIEALPGVASASLSYSMPFFGLAEPRRYLVAGLETPAPGREPAAVINGVSPRYFETVGTRLRSGRTFQEADTSTSPKVYVVNEAMARGLFDGESPIGRRIAAAGGTTTEWGEIVGVVADVQSVYPDRPTVTNQVYLPIAQEPRRSFDLAVRTTGAAPTTVVQGIRAAMMSLDPDLTVRKLQPAQATIVRANYQDGVLATVLSALALLGLGLASLGVYGVIARTVARRTGEFGIRLALGAQARDITRLVLSSGARLALTGAALGVLGALGVTRLLAAGFPSMHGEPLPVLAGATVLLMGIAQVACYVPARRAARISPTETLRAE